MDNRNPNPKPMEDSAPEVRSFEIRLDDQEGGRAIRGFAVVFDSPADASWYGAEWKEVVDGRAFDGVDMSDVKLLWNHNTDIVLGSTRGNPPNLTLIPLPEGIAFRCELLDTPHGDEALELIRRGIVDQCSFGFSIAAEEWDEERKIRKILRVKRLYELSVCPWGAYPQTVVETIRAESEVEEPEAEPVPDAVQETPTEDKDLGLLADAFLIE